MPVKAAADLPEGLVALADSVALAVLADSLAEARAAEHLPVPRAAVALRFRPDSRQLVEQAVDKGSDTQIVSSQPTLGSPDSGLDPIWHQPRRSSSSWLMELITPGSAG